LIFKKAYINIEKRITNTIDNIRTLLSGLYMVI